MQQPYQQYPWDQTEWVLEPIVDLSCEQVRAYELLTRPCPGHQHLWRDLYRRIPGFIHDLRDSGRVAETTTISVNVDTLHILDAQIMNSLEELAGLGVAIEWTEYRQAITGNGDDRINEVAVNLRRFRDATGLELWIDDAGTGEDALGRISATKPDLVKISGKLFRKSLVDEASHNLVGALITTLRAMKLTSVIEWVEKAEEREIALAHGADWAQGYLWPGHTAGSPKDMEAA